MLDVIGIGFGPANIALAVALEELTEGLRVQFLEKRSGPRWQEGMLLEESDIQNHPLRDLVTPRNPRSRYSFTNFLFENDRLFEHLNLGLPFPLRIEYEQYVRWVAGFFAHQVQYDVNVSAIEPLVDSGTGILLGYRVRDAAGREWCARSVVVAPGRTPNVPAQFAHVDSERIVHLNDYLFALKRACEGGRKPRVAVVGGSQSAVEILLHAHGLGSCEKVVGITRNFGFRQKDTSPFSDEVYFPQFVQTFFFADQPTKDRLRTELEPTNYSSADKDVVEALYLKLYANRILQRDSLAVRTNTEVSHVSADAPGVQLTLRDTVTDRRLAEEFDLVVLATGFLDIGSGPKREAYPRLLAGVAPLLELSRGHLDVSIDYRVQFANKPDGAAPLYLNGLCESSHGMGDSGSFSLLALRSAAIAQSLAAQLAPSPASRDRTQDADSDLVSDAVR
ncbi:l-ornithine 5-monooxygenase [Paraburkholderia lacunae]|uniref:L-ornithine 5-monooxygenase n=2 Tax=Paraburkholderia lacunae TaxID=2211104 RepID=A0A370NBD8_9BURK|nr:l-ornithine 5-monooxygenase [Paraburkholderia lacunae]